MVCAIRHIVEIVVREGVERIREIIEWGAQFDKDNAGDYSLVKKAATVSLEFCITKMLREMKWKEHCLLQ